jgi:hypothetical protein
MRKLATQGLARAVLLVAIPLSLWQAPPVLAQAAAATPDPAREAALRRFIEGRIQNNTPYDLLTADLADRVRKVPVEDWGALKSLSQKGSDATTYDAHFEKAHITFLIGPLTPDGKISNLAYLRAVDRAPGTENGPSPGVQQALRQLLDGKARGQVPAELFGDAIAARFRNHQTPFGDENTEVFDALGALHSLAFLKVDAMGNDNYLAVYDHGHATWVIPPLVNGKVDNLLWGNVLVDNAKPHPGSEMAARHFVDITLNGGQDASLMPPENPAAQQRLADNLKKLGALQSLTFKGGFRTTDIYAASFANGPAVIRVDTIIASKMRVAVTPGTDM